MSTDQNQGDFSPVVKGGYKSDAPLHRRNWRQLSDFLRTNFVTNDRLADGSIDEAKIQDLAVTDAKIETLTVTKLTTGTLSADVLMAGIIRTAETGQRVEIDSNGIRLNDGTDDVVSIPVAGEATFHGGINASSLTSDGTTLRGNTLVDAGGTFQFTEGLANPSVAPTLVWTYDQVTLNSGTVLRGAEYDTTNSRVIACYPNGHQIYGFPAAGGVPAWNWHMTQGGVNCKSFGAVRLGSFIYAIGEKEGTTKLVLQKYTLSSGVPVSVSDSVSSDAGSFPFVNYDHLAGITTDGTDLYVAWQNTGGSVTLNKFNTSLVYQSQQTLAAGLGATAYDIAYKSTAGCVWWLAVDTGVGFTTLAYTSTPTYTPNENFSMPTDSRGVLHDGTQFVTVDTNGGYYRKHTDWRSTSPYINAKYSWYKTGSAYESVPSTRQLAANPKRSILRVTWPTPPGAADRTRVYMLEGLTAPTAGSMKLQGTETGTSQMYSTFNSGGSADVTTTSFPASEPATLLLPRKGSAPSTAAAGQMYYDTGTNKAYVYNGATWNALF